MKIRNLFLSVLLATGMTANAQNANVEVQTGNFTPVRYSPSKVERTRTIIKNGNY